MKKFILILEMFFRKKIKIKVYKIIPFNKIINKTQ